MSGQQYKYDKRVGGCADQEEEEVEEVEEEENRRGGAQEPPRARWKEATDRRRIGG